MDCVFCKIVKGELPAEKIYEDKDILAFLDINPVNYGHALIFTKEHYQWMYDVPDDLIGKIFVKTKKLMKKIKDAMKADFVRVVVVGLHVPHFHIHLIPSYLNDGTNNFWPTKKYGKGEEKKTADKLRKELTE